MTNLPIRKADLHERKVLAIGSILQFAKDHDVIWGSGINGNCLDIGQYQYRKLDVRAVRGPLTKRFLEQLGVKCPEIYGDPALLIPRFFPEFRPNPKRSYLVIPHISERNRMPQSDVVIYPTEPWEVIVRKIVESRFVISSSLHGIIVAEAFGIPARLLRISENESILKYQDYYLGTGRKSFRYARSVEEALRMGGEVPAQCNIDKLQSCFPYEVFR